MARWSRWLALAACGVVGEGAGLPAAQAERMVEVRVHDAGYMSVVMQCHDGRAWTKDPLALYKVGAWWIRAFPAAGDAEFCLRVDGQWRPGGKANNYRAAPGTVWIKDGILFDYDPTAARPAGSLSVLTVNLHTYQETDARKRLSWVAELIAQGDVDLVAFQECAQRTTGFRDDGKHAIPVRADNMARLIADELAAVHGKAYTWYWDWSHVGFGFYEEGSAVMGKAAFANPARAMRYISTSDRKTSIDSRTAVFGAFQVPGIGRVHLFTTHVSWGPPQAGQLDALKAWAAEMAKDKPVATLLCGDWNMNYEEAGYRRMTADGAWLDAALAAAPRGAKDPTLGPNRIDYQFVNRGSRLVPVLAQRVFLHLAGPVAAERRVSDHVGVLVRYRLR